MNEWLTMQENNRQKLDLREAQLNRALQMCKKINRELKTKDWDDIVSVLEEEEGGVVECSENSGVSYGAPYSLHYLLIGDCAIEYDAINQDACPVVTMPQIEDQHRAMVCMG